MCFPTIKISCQNILFAAQFTLSLFIFKAISKSLKCYQQAKSREELYMCHNGRSWPFEAGFMLLYYTSCVGGIIYFAYLFKLERSGNRSDSVIYSDSDYFYDWYICLPSVFIIPLLVICPIVATIFYLCIFL